MTPRLQAGLHARLLHLCDLAKATPPEHDVGPALDALGVLLWSAAVGERDGIDAGLSKRLKQLASRTQLALRTKATDSKDEDAAITNAALTDMVRAALLVIDRKPIADASPALSISKLHPPSRTFTRMLEGSADGLTTARHALHILDCARCQHTLAALPDHDRATQRTPALARSAGARRERSQMKDAGMQRLYAPMPTRDLLVAEPMMRFAAADVTHVRAPEEGRVIGSKRKPPLEAVLFNDPDARRLAIYSTDDINIRVIADGLTTEATLTGYCLTRLDHVPATLDVTLHLNERPLPWELSLRNTAPRKRASRKQHTPKAARRKPR